ncbi:hypothetical protein EDEG_02828 [Edhazardia aedis USNM 41457]|uniref:Transmembrane protein n=1 Tax=Edhazardia aedis (strain USNM 41457) TaxID=1003232 RepID=J8ZSZ4_EDHAE|nr:hypothetical protein EDEG_02828 [Edhazardia aedis USNM 41457]|eukprot:EJW02788.1 hypothetical protein EDEG_02828 [Edhazardia aedis USNM 41457]
MFFTLSDILNLFIFLCILSSSFPEFFSYFFNIYFLSEIHIYFLHNFFPCDQHQIAKINHFYLKMEKENISTIILATQSMLLNLQLLIIFIFIIFLQYIQI